MDFVHLKDPGDLTKSLCGLRVWYSLDKTCERDQVTCKRCLRMMAKDEREAGV
jgi:hypothetical protein